MIFLWVTHAQANQYSKSQSLKRSSVQAFKRSSGHGFMRSKAHMHKHRQINKCHSTQSRHGLKMHEHQECDGTQKP